MALTTLWLTDRSRYERGLGHCLRARYLEAHAGPHGYGWVRKAQSMPAVTGTLIHDPITEGILQSLLEHDTIPPAEDVHAAIVAAQAKYRAQVETRGLLHTTDPQELELRILEQTTLLEGMVWTWYYAALPAFHEEWKVVEVETEHVSVVGCTCGLGDRVGTAEEHSGRECAGIGWMSRGDCLTERRATGTLAYHDFKSTGMNSGNWRDTWYHRVQVMAGVLGAEERFGKLADEVWIHPLYKGAHKAEWDPIAKAAVGPKFQNSILCYGWYREANPPLQASEWAAQYDYVDEDGKKRRLGKDFKRRGVWLLEPELWQQEGIYSPSHYWVSWVAPTGALQSVWEPIGPIFREQWKLDQFLAQMVAHEQGWQQILWRLYESGLGWETAECQALLDQLVPMARGEACQNAFGDRCPNLRLCNREPGWETPELLGYLPRRPHHQPELDQAISRGLLPPEEGAAETEE